MRIATWHLTTKVWKLLFLVVKNATKVHRCDLCWETLLELITYAIPVPWKHWFHQFLPDLDVQWPDFKRRKIKWGKGKFLFGPAQMSHLSNQMGGGGGGEVHLWKCTSQIWHFCQIDILVKFDIFVKFNIFVNCWHCCQLLKFWSNLIFLSNLIFWSTVNIYINYW